MEDLRGPLVVPDEAFASLLRMDQMVNDQAISAYLRLLERRSILLPEQFRIWAYDTFFYVAFKQGGFERVKRWNRGQNLFEKDIVLFPIHILEEAHWALVVAWPKRKVIHALDSLGRDRSGLVKDIISYFHSLAEAMSLTFNKAEWLLIGLTAATRQPEKSLDCGAFVCWYSEQLARNSPVNGITVDTVALRRRIASALRKSAILGQTSFADDETANQLFNDEAMLSPLPTPATPKFNPNFRMTSGVCKINGEVSQFWTSWDPVLEALNEAIDNNYEGVQSPVTLVPTPKESVSSNPQYRC
jgi:hypothetical protein